MTSLDPHRGCVRRRWLQSLAATSKQTMTMTMMLVVEQGGGDGRQHLQRRGCRRCELQLSQRRSRGMRERVRRMANPYGRALARHFAVDYWPIDVFRPHQRHQDGTRARCRLRALLVLPSGRRADGWAEGSSRRQAAAGRAARALCGRVRTPQRMALGQRVVERGGPVVGQGDRHCCL